MLKITEKYLAYDVFGNRTRKTDGLTETQYVYNELNQLIKKEGLEEAEEYIYDKRGNLSKIIGNEEVTSYEFDVMGKMTKAVTPKGESEYSYNGLGHRVGMKEHDHQFNPGKQVEYILDLTKDYNNLLQKREQGEVQTYLWDRELVGVKNSMTVEEELEEANQGSSYYLVDELGSPLRVKGVGTLSINETYGYDEFGKDLYNNQTKTQPFSFTGYQKDEGTGLHYAQARYYDGNLGRFIGQDMVKGNIGKPDTLNEYKYCLNNPMKYVDRDGRKEKDEGKPDEATVDNKPESDFNYVYYLNAEDGAGGKGHVAILLVTEDGTGVYCSNALKGNITTYVLDESKVNILLNEGIIEAKGDDITNSGNQYNRNIGIRIIDSQGEKMYNYIVGLETNEEVLHYDIALNNCNMVALCILNVGHVPIAEDVIRKYAYGIIAFGIGSFDETDGDFDEKTPNGVYEYLLQRQEGECVE